MTLSNPRYVINDGYPELHVTIEGRESVLFYEPQKSTLFQAGYVFLGPEFADKLPVIKFPVPGYPGEFLELRGFTDDPRVVKLFSRFVDDLQNDRFTEGPVAMPPG